MLQCVAVCCSVLQCVAVCRSVLQCSVVGFKKSLATSYGVATISRLLQIICLFLQKSPTDSFKLYVSFAKEPYKTDYILQCSVVGVMKSLATS